MNYLLEIDKQLEALIIVGISRQEKRKCHQELTCTMLMHYVFGTL
jgi:hypothetical protein